MSPNLPRRRLPVRLAGLLALVVLGGGLFVTPSLSAGARAANAAELPMRYRQWLAEVALLISKREKREFLALEKDYQRDAFIAAFWKARDPYPETARNEFEDAWRARLEQARSEFGNLEEDRARILLLNGAPEGRRLADCVTLTYPLDLWIYARSEKVGAEVPLVFYQRRGIGTWSLWRPSDSILDLFSEPKENLITLCKTYLSRREQQGIDNSAPDLPLICVQRLLHYRCTDGDLVYDAIFRTKKDPTFDFLQMRMEERPEPKEGEWLLNFAAYSTDLPADAETFDAQLAFAFPGRHQSRTVVAGRIEVAPDEVVVDPSPERSSYDFQLWGEVLRQGAMFESFRYRFDVPAPIPAGQPIALVFERFLRPGVYHLVLKLEDLHGKRFFRTERDLSVPAPAGEETDAERVGRELLAAAGAELADGASGIRLTGPGPGPQTGPVRFSAVTLSPAVDKVTFYLDGTPQLSKRTPPYSVELDLGSVPSPHEVRVEAVDAAGRVLASDRLALNRGDNRFSVRLLAPSSGAHVEGATTVSAAVEVPEEKALDRLEIWVGERQVAVLYQPPFRQVVPVGAGPGYVRAVAYLDDGSSTEDLALVNAPDVSEQVRVDLVELYATVVDGSGRPVLALGRDDFRVREDGTPQQIVRFEQVAERPLHVTILLDSSASMEKRLPTARDAALEFFRRVVTPRDRASFVAFDDRPHVLVRFTNDLDRLATALAPLHAERGTALFDSLIATLYSFQGVAGRRAILLLTDGRDESSRFRYQDALRYAELSGVTIYTIGLDLPFADLGSRHELTELAEVTGGRSFFIDDTGELAAIYRQIEDELRSQYLLVYQSTSVKGPQDFRQVEVQLDRPGLTAKTIRGYYP